MEKILITTIQVNLMPNPSGGGNSRIVVIKLFAINLPSQPFLGRHLGFYIFFHPGLFGGHTLFLQLGCFGLDYFFLLTKLDRAHFTYDWCFCYNPMTVSAISFKPQKVCTTKVTPCTHRFSSHSFKLFTLWP